MKQAPSVSILPDFFKPIFWSYDFENLDPQKDSQLIICQTINYGVLAHWSWIKNFYGEDKIRQVISKTQVTAFRPPALRLAALIFRITRFNYVSRSPNQ